MADTALVDIVAELPSEVEDLEPFPEDFSSESEGEQSQYTELEGQAPDYLPLALETEVRVEYRARESDTAIKDYLRRAAALSNTSPEYHIQISQRIESARNEVIRTCFYDAHPLAYQALFHVVDDDTLPADKEDTTPGIGGFAAQLELLRKLDQRITHFGVALSGRRKRTLEGYIQEGVRIAQTLPLHMDYWRDVCTLIPSVQLQPIAHQRGIDTLEVEQLERRISTALRTHDKYVVSLMEANLLLVVSIAKRYQHRGLELMELVQEGNFGLKIGAERFDYKRGNKFSTYATWWIRQNITRAISDKAKTIRLPARLIDSLNELSRTTIDLTRELGREPTNEEIIRRMDISVEKLEHLRDVSRVEAETTLDAPLSSGNEVKDNLVDRMACDAESPTGVDRLYLIQMREKLADVLSKLKPFEADVLRLRFGFSSDVLTLKEVGRRYKLSHEKIRRVQEEALGKLRRHFEELGIRE